MGAIGTMSESLGVASSLHRVIRSALFVLPHDPRSVDRARSARPDVAIVDLEDGVPAEHKMTARRRLPTVMTSLEEAGVRTVVRVSETRDPDHGDEVFLAIASGAEAIVLPKADPIGVRRLARRLPDQGPAVGIWAMVESFAAGDAAQATLRAGPVDAVTIGYGDLCKELDLPLGSEHPELAPVRDQVLLAGRSVGVKALDGLLVGPPEVAEAACTRSAGQGFAGRLLYDSRHVEGCNRAFGQRDDPV